MEYGFMVVESMGIEPITGALQKLLASLEHGSPYPVDILHLELKSFSDTFLDHSSCPGYSHSGICLIRHSLHILYGVGSPQDVHGPKFFDIAYPVESLHFLFISSSPLACARARSLAEFSRNNLSAASTSFLLIIDMKN